MLKRKTEKYITFAIIIEKEVRKTYGNLLSNLVNNLSVGIHKIKCKYGQDDKRYQRIFRSSFLEYNNFKDYLIECKCLPCNKNYQRNFAEKSKERFFVIYHVSTHDNNKFTLLLPKVVYPYEYIDD